MPKSNRLPRLRLKWSVWLIQAATLLNERRFCIMLRVRHARQQKLVAELCSRRSRGWDGFTNTCRKLPARCKRWEIVHVRSTISSRLSPILRTRRTAWRWTRQFRLLWQVRTAKDLAQLRQTSGDWRNAQKTRPVQSRVLYEVYVKISGLWPFR